MTALAIHVAHMLAQERFPALLARRHAAQASVWEAERAHREAAHNVPFWDQVLFFHESADEERVAALEASLEERRRVLHAVEVEIYTATQRVWQRYPAVEIVHRIECLTSTLLAADPFDRLPSPLGVASGQATSQLLSVLDVPDSVVTELEAVADRVFALWAPETRPGAALQALYTAVWAADRERAPTLGGRSIDPDRGWLPISQVEVVALAVASLSPTEIQRLRSAIEQAHQTVAAAQARLSALESGPPGEGEEAARARRSRCGWESTAVLNAQMRAIGAEQELWSVLKRALGAYPPLAIALAARAAAGTARCAFACNTSRLGIQRDLITSAPGRALFLAALLDLRRALEFAFPDLTAVVSGRDARTRLAPPTSPTKGAIFAKLSHSRARELLKGGVDLGLSWSKLESPGTRPGASVDFPDLPSPSAGADATSEFARSRRFWHIQTMFALGSELDTITIRACDAEPFARMALSIERVWMAIASSDFEHWRGDLDLRRARTEQTRVEGVRAIDQLAHDLRTLFNLHDDWSVMLHAVAGVLRGGPVRRQPLANTSLSRAAIIRGVAGELAATTFLRNFDRIAALHAAAGSHELVLMSPHAREYQELLRAVHTQFEAAIGWYPPAVLLSALSQVRTRLLAIQTEVVMSDGFEPRGTVVGTYEAKNALSAWRLRATRVFGRLLTVDYVLSDWTRRLVEEDAGDARLHPGQ